MSQPERIGIVVEGKSEEVLFRELRPWFQRRGKTLVIINAQERPRLIQDARRHLQALRLKGCSQIVFLLDQEDDECPPATASRLNTVREEADVLVCVAARKMEAWLLADTEAVRQATQQEFQDLPTDSLVQPDERLKELFRRRYGRSWSKVEMVKAFSSWLDLARAARGNRSAQRFLNRLSGGG